MITRRLFSEEDSIRARDWSIDGEGKNLRSEGSCAMAAHRWLKPS